MDDKDLEVRVSILEQITSDMKNGFNETREDIKDIKNYMHALTRAVAVFQNAPFPGYDAAIAIRSGNSGDTFLYFVDKDDENIGSINYDNYNNSMNFRTNTIYSIVLTSSGDLGVGFDKTTSPSYKLHVKENAFDHTALIENTDVGSGSTGIVVQCGESIAAQGNAGNVICMSLKSNSGTQMSSVRYTATSPYAQFSALSDARLKTNVQPTDLKGLDIINSIELKQYNWKESGIHQEIGYIAQQVENVYPPIASIDPETGYKSVGDGCLVSVLVKAVQKLSAEIERLKTNKE